MNDQIEALMNWLTDSLNNKAKTLESATGTLEQITQQMMKNNKQAKTAGKKIRLIKQVANSIIQMHQNAAIQYYALQRASEINRIKSDIHTSNKASNEDFTYEDEKNRENEELEAINEELEATSEEEEAQSIEEQAEEELQEEVQEQVEEKLKEKAQEQAKEKAKEQAKEQAKDKAKDQVKAKAKDASKKALKKAGKAVAKAASKAFLALIKFLFVPPVLYFTLAVIAIILIILLFCLIFGGGSEYANVDTANGIFGTSKGITGDNFYGARAIYYNPAQAQADLKDYYYAFGEDFLDNIDEMEHINIKINIDLENTTSEMGKLIAKAVSGSSDDLAIENYLTLIDHFGYTNLELDSIQESFVDYVETNKETILDISEDYEGDLNTDLNTVFETKYEAADSYYNVTAPLYYVTDILLEPTKESMIPSQVPKNNVALIYMPRKAVGFSSTSYMFYFPEEEREGYATSVQLDFIKVENGSETILYNNTADSSWWQDDQAKNTAEIEAINTALSTFLSIDLSNPLVDVNLYSLLFGENSTPSLSNVEKCFSANEVVDSDAGLNYYEISYLPTLDSVYLYLRLNGDGFFQFCERETICES